MGDLSKEQRDLILDFYFRCGEDDDINHGRDLIASDPEAAKLYADLEETLKMLDAAKYEPCPDNLVELTVAQLKMAASVAGQSLLEDLLEEEQKKTQPVFNTGSRRAIGTAWWNYAQVFAVAATFLVISSIGVAVFANMRNLSQQACCKSRLRHIGAGFARYAEDNDGTIPYVAGPTGAPWFPGQQNAGSNNRHVYLLASGHYVDGKNFVCPGRKSATPISIGAEELYRSSDFPSIENVSFSFGLLCAKSCRKLSRGQFPLASDRNPLFEDALTALQNNACPSFSVSVDDRLRKMMSANHRRKGQNIVFSDGSVEFYRQRCISDDDIFTQKARDVYDGFEKACDEDFFMVP